MNNTLIKEYFSDDRLRTSMVFIRNREFRVVCLDSYLESQTEHFFTHAQQAEDFAEDWVLRENAPL